MVSAGWHEGGTNRAARDATVSRYASALANTSTAWRVAYRLMWVYIFTLAFFSDAVGAVGITFDALIRDAGVSKVRVLLSDVLFDRKELINSVSAIVCAVHKLAKVAIWAIISASIGRRGATGSGVGFVRASFAGCLLQILQNAPQHASWPRDAGPAPAPGPPLGRRGRGARSPRERARTP